MVKMSKAQMRKRLTEAVGKINKVYISQRTDTFNGREALSLKDAMAAVTILTKAIDKMK
jgi:hypothetical protein